MKHVLNSKEAKVIFLLCIAQMFKYCLIYDNMSKGSGSPGIAVFFIILSILLPQVLSECFTAF